MKCPKCQYELIENAKFCQNCGINVDVENDTKNAKQLESKNSDNSRFLGTILGLLIVGFIAYGCITQAIHYGDTYRGALQDIKNEQWSSAKSKLEVLGNYRDCEILLPDVNYNYYLQTGNENFNNKNYSGALLNYEQAKLYKNTDETLTVKIQKTKDLLAKQEAEQRKAQEIAKKKAEQERLRKQREKELKDKEELSELTRMVNQAFVRTEFFDAGDSFATGFNFYAYPDAWYQLSYTEQQNVFASCVKYVELKLGVSSNHALKYTHIINIYSDLPMASYTILD